MKRAELTGAPGSRAGREGGAGGMGGGWTPEACRAIAAAMWTWSLVMCAIEAVIRV